MHRSIAAPVAISIAIHATLLLALIGIRYRTSETPTFGAVDVTWVVVGDRIDAGSSRRNPAVSRGGTPAAVSAAGDQLPGEPSARALTPAAPSKPAARPAPAVRPAAPAPAARPARAAEGIQRSAPPDEVAAPRSAEVRFARAQAPVVTRPAHPAEVSSRPDRIPARPPPASTIPDIAPARPENSPEVPGLTADGPDPGRASAYTPVLLPSLLPTADVDAEPLALLEREPSRDPTDESATSLHADPLVAEVQALSLDPDVLSAAVPVEFEHDGQDYTAAFRVLPAANDMGLDELIVAVSTERGGDRRTTEMRFKRLAFSHFAQFVDRWDPAVRVHDDEIDGRFHSNSEIYIDTSRGVGPTFHGKVTTTRGISTSNGSGRFRRSEVFLGGLETRIKRISLPREWALLPPHAPAEQLTHRFTEDTRVTFYADGSYGWRNADSSLPEQRKTMPGATFYLLGGDDAELFVRGIVNGRVLVHARENIVIEGDLTYAADPDVDPGADDYLGLVSDRSVEIAEPEVTGPGDLDVHASIYAKRRFVVRHYGERPGATLSILGSLTAGSLTATEPRYRTRLRFDPRLETARPPGFPMTDRYELAAWDGVWAR